MLSKQKKLSLNVISFILRQLSELQSFLSDKPIDKKDNYEDLTPIDDVKKSAPYINALEWALQNKNIKNIALTGPYGSGKTSILKTFEKGHPKYHYLNISLASFQDEIRTETEVKGILEPAISKQINYEERHRLIELSILQQMFYKVDGKEIPDSRFNRIKSLSNGLLWLYMGIVFLTIVGFTIIITPGFWEGFSWWSKMSDPFCDWFRYGAFAMLMPAFYFLSRYIIRLFNFSKFNKINLTKGELEFDPKSETSILNKHLDEILYYFEVTPFNVVFIEDLDRFNDPEIFTKLRELNILINQSKQVNRRIVFIYVIKDDMFKDEARTKFFDFIIPVIPVINSSNSFDIMLKKVEDTDIELKIDEVFLSNVTLFIDDMRVLKNIFNEFLLYRETLKDISLKDEEIFAMIVYKNKYPNDFASLHNKKGVLYRVFTSAKKVKEEIIRRKTQEIGKIESAIADLQLNKHLSVIELRSIYLVEMIADFSAAVGLVINGVMKPLSQIRSNDEDFLWLTSQSSIYCYHFNSSYGENRAANTKKSFADIEAKVNPNLSFKDRETLINENLLNGTDKLKSDIEKHKTGISTIKKMKVAEILSLEPDSINNFDSAFSNTPLLVYLVRNGFINEQYNILVSYFYPGHLTINDMDFALSVANREPLDFEFELTKLDKLISRLDVDDFLEPAILNYSLADYVSLNLTDYQEQFNYLIKQLSSESNEALRFIDAYFENGTQQPILFKALFKNWKRLWKYIVNDSGYSREKQISYLIFIANNADNKDFKNLNMEESLDSYVNAMVDFVEIFDKPDLFSGAKNLLDNLHIQFPSLVNVTSSPQLFDYIYDNWLYALNPEMIGIVLSQKSIHDISNLPSFDKANYTNIRASGAQTLIEYIEQFTANYVEEIILNRETNTEESEETLLLLLNLPTDKLSLENKKELIKQQSVQILEITHVINTELWAVLLDQGKIFANWLNILEYFGHLDILDNHLFNYISRPEVFSAIRTQSFIKFTTKPDALYYKFSLATLLKNEFEEPVYDAILDSNPYHYTSTLDVKGLSAAKVNKLIQRKKFLLNPEQFAIIQENFPELIGTFIIHNIAIYLKDKTQYVLTDIVYIELFNSTISGIEKITLLKDLTDARLEENATLASCAVKVILSQSEYHITNEQLSIFITKGMKKSDSLHLFAKCITQVDKFLADKLLSYLNEPYKRLTQRGKQTKLPLNDLNKKLVNGLKIIGYLKNPSFKNNEIKVYNKKSL